MVRTLPVGGSRTISQNFGITPLPPDTNRLLYCRKSLLLKPKTWKSGADTIPGNFTRWAFTSYFLPGRKGRVMIPEPVSSGSA